MVLLAAICGLAGGAIIFMFLTKVLMPHERELTADETDVVGAVGRVSSADSRRRDRGDCVPADWARRDLRLRDQTTAGDWERRRGLRDSL